jgi:phosphatidate cytidylyltransferase
MRRTEIEMRMSGFENLATRILAALIGIPLIVWGTMQGGYYFFLIVCVISSLALFEFYKLSEVKGARPLKTLGIAAGILINGIILFERIQGQIYRYCLAEFGICLPVYSQYQLIVIIFMKLMLVTLLIELFRKKGSPILNVGATISGVVIVSFSFTALLLLREAFPSGFPFAKVFHTPFADSGQLAQIDRWGGYTVVSVIVSIWMCDTAAYFGGSRFGRHRLFERVSPRKSVEGAVFGLFFAVLSMLIAKIFLLEYLSVFHSIVIGIIVGLFGQAGDLIESRFKRDAGVKDSSLLIPGHGGVYDRFDSLVYISPIVYLYISFVVLS